MWVRGDRPSEPIGTVNGLVLVQETLTFDWSSLTRSSSKAADSASSNGRGILTATYEIDNPGDPVSINLVFNSFGMMRGRVTLDDERLPLKPIDSSAASTTVTGLQAIRLPQFGSSTTNGVEDITPNRIPPVFQRWNRFPPDRQAATIGDLEQQTAPRLAEPGVGVATKIPNGRHTLAVRYFIRPYMYHGHHVYRDYVIGYRFAPDPSWQRIERFDLEVKVPQNWEVATSLPTLRRHDTIWGTYLNGLPAEGVAIAIRYPLHPIARLTSLGLRLGGILLAFVVASRVTRWAIITWGDRALKSAKSSKSLNLELAGLSTVAFLFPSLLGIWLGYKLLDSDYISTVWQQQFIMLHGGLLLIGMVASILLTANQHRLNPYTESQYSSQDY
jgi:hypothetical protein